MSAVTIVFLAIGAFAIVLLGLSVFGAHLHLGDLHLGHGGADLGGGGGADIHAGADLGGNPGNVTGHGGLDLSLPVIAGFLGALGFGGAIASVPLGGHGPLTVLAAAVIGLAVAVPMGWLAGRIVRAAIDMPTDATPASTDLLGASGVVVTPVPTSGYGEVRVTVAGTPMKLNARCDQPLDLGTRIFVIEVPSPTSVLVEPVPGLNPNPLAANPRTTNPPELSGPPEPTGEGRQ